MVTDLGSLVDALYDDRRAGRQIRKRLIFIVGDGIRPVQNILSDRRVTALAAKRGLTPGTDAFNDFKWRLFEYARYYTSNWIPSFAHCCIHRLMADGLCSHVITTNYDLFFDSIWSKYPAMRVATNPVASKGEYTWDGYYSRRGTHLPPLCYWKIHGSLSHGVFNRLPLSTREYLLVRLPRMAIATNQPEIARAYRLPTTCPFLGQEATENRRTRFPNFHQLEPTFQPYIDWNYSGDRSRFQREIDAVKSILKTPKHFAGIVLLGFRGYFNSANPSDPFNEELVPILQKLITSGFNNVFMLVRRGQFISAQSAAFELLHERFQSGRGMTYSNAGSTMRDLLSIYSHRFPYNLVDAEYAKWANYYYLSTKEATHA